jgi:tripartite-type tricarboxylate transporter receptor subunit TctC
MQSRRLPASRAPQGSTHFPVVFAAAIATVVAAVFATQGTMAQDYPTKPVRVITEFVAGSGGDVFLRSYIPALSQASGQQWVVENRGGAGGLVAIEAIQRSTPDGYTLLAASQNVPVTRRFLSKAKPVDATVEMTPVSALWRSTLVIASNPAFPPKTLKELIAHVSANPGKIAYTTSGVGTQGHFAGASLEQLTGTTLIHIPYNNNLQVSDVLSGAAPLTISIVPFVLPHLPTGKLNAIAVAGYRRLESMPNVPLVSETLPKFEPPPTWTGIFGPPGLPKNIVARLEAIVAKAITSPELKAAALKGSFDLLGTTAEEFTAQINRDIEIAGRQAKAAKITPTD